MATILIIVLCLPLVLWPFFSIKRDFFFFVLYFQIVLYLHLAPLMVGLEMDHHLKVTYVLLMIFCLILFEVPLLLIYTGSKKKKINFAEDQKDHKLRVSFNRLFIILLLLSCFSGAFVFVVLKNGLLYRRLGIGATSRLVTLSFGEHFIYRMFINSGIFFTSVLLVIYLMTSPKSKVRILAFISLFSAGGIYAIYALVNSRLETFTLLLFIVGILLSRSKYSFIFTRKNLVLAVFLILSFLYTIRVAENVRSNYLREGIQISHFNPFYKSPVKSFSIELAKRLNGIDLMAKMTPSAKEDFFARGKAWEKPIIATFGALFKPKQAKQLKLERMTTTKRYLMIEYTSITSPDYPSCRLVGPYGNFGPLGFLLVAALLGIFCRLGIRWFFSFHSPFLIVLGIFILFHILQFELSFISIFLDWLKSLPLLLIFVILNPLKKPIR